MLICVVQSFVCGLLSRTWGLFWSDIKAGERRGSLWIVFQWNVCGCLKQQAVIMISKGPHLRDQPAEYRTSLTNELLNISPSLSCLLFFHSGFYSGFFSSFCFAFILFSTIFLVFCIFFYLHCQAVSLKSRQRHIYVNPTLFLSLFFFLKFLKKSVLHLSCLSPPLLFDVCFLAHWNSVGWFFDSFVSQQQHPVQTSSSVYT